MAMFLAGLSAIGAPIVASVLTAEKKDSKWDSERYTIHPERQQAVKARAPVLMTREDQRQKQPAPATAAAPPNPPVVNSNRKPLELLQNMEHSFSNYGLVSLNPGASRIADREQMNYVDNLAPDYAAPGGNSFLSFTLDEAIYDQTPTTKDVTVHAKNLPRNIRGEMKVTKIGTDFAKGEAFVNDDGTIIIRKGLICGKRVLSAQPGTLVLLDVPDQHPTSLLDYDARNRPDKVDSITNPRMELDNAGKAVLLNAFEDTGSTKETTLAIDNQRRNNLKKIQQENNLRSNDGFTFGPSMEKPDLDERQVSRITRDGCPVRRGGRNWENEKPRMSTTVDFEMRSKPLRMRKKTDMTVRHGILIPDAVRVHRARSNLQRDPSSRSGENHKFARSVNDRSHLSTTARSKSDDMVRRKGQIGGLGVRTKHSTGLNMRDKGRGRVSTKLRRLETVPGILLNREPSRGRATGTVDFYDSSSKRAPHTKYRREAQPAIFDGLVRNGMRSDYRTPSTSTSYETQSAMKYQTDEYTTIHGGGGMEDVIHGSHRNREARDVIVREDSHGVVRTKRRQAWAAAGSSARSDNVLNFTGPKNDNFHEGVATHREREHTERSRNPDNVTDQTYRHGKVHAKHVTDRQGATARGIDRYRRSALETDVPVSLRMDRDGEVLHKDTRDTSNRVGIVGNPVLMDGVASQSSRKFSRNARTDRDTNSTVKDVRILSDDMRAASGLMDTGVQHTMRFVKASEGREALREVFKGGEHPQGYVPQDAESAAREDSIVQNVLNYDAHSKEVPIVSTGPTARHEGDGGDEEGVGNPLQNPVVADYDPDREVRFMPHRYQDADYDA
jgi:hypothetical protein